MNAVIKTLMITALFTIVAVGSAWADRIDIRQARQLQRISCGVSSGQLIKYEARELMREQRTITRRIRIARADGILTHFEYHRLKCLQDRAGRNIRRLMHNHLIYRTNRVERGAAPVAAQRRSTYPQERF